MYKVKTKVEISAAHYLILDYASPCTTLHGHNWNITVYVKGEKLKNDMLIDFAQIKNVIKGKFDHKLLNENFDFNPTAERIACFILNRINHEVIRDVDTYCYKVEVEETNNNIASYEIN